MSWRKKLQRLPPSVPITAAVPSSQLSPKLVGNTESKSQDTERARAAAFAWARVLGRKPSSKLNAVWFRVAEAAESVSCSPALYTEFQLRYAGRTLWPQELASSEARNRFRNWVENRDRYVLSAAMSSESSLAIQVQAVLERYPGSDPNPIALSILRSSPRYPGPWVWAKSVALNDLPLAESLLPRAAQEYTFAASSWDSTLEVLGFSPQIIQKLKDEVNDVELL